VCVNFQLVIVTLSIYQEEIKINFTLILPNFNEKEEEKETPNFSILKRRNMHNGQHKIRSL